MCITDNSYNNYIITAILHKWKTTNKQGFTNIDVEKLKLDTEPYLNINSTLKRLSKMTNKHIYLKLINIIIKALTEIQTW